MEKHISIVNQLAQLDELAVAIEGISEEWELPMSLSMNLNLVLEELVTNIIFYGYEDTNEHHINIMLDKEDKLITVQIEDDAREFNPLLMAEPNIENSIEDRKIGGLGIFFVRKIMEEVTYKRDGNKNVLTMTKSIE
jgi:anti-sigma regulatory factor (Ser/Thr protein kinase)